MVKRKFRLAIIEDLPVHYRVPIYQEMNKFREELNYHVYFFSLANNSKRYLMGVKNKEKIKVDFKGVKYSLIKNYYPFKNPSLPKGLWNLGIFPKILFGDFDAVTIHGYSAVGKRLAILAAILSRTPILFKEEINEINGNALKKFLKTPLYWILFRLPRFFLCSYTKNQEFYESFGVPKTKCVLHPCAVDNEKYRKLSKKINKTKIRKKLNIPLKDTVFICMGTIDKRKDSFNVLKAFEKLNDSHSHLIFVGEGPEKYPMKKYTEKNKIKNVIFIPFIGDHKKLAEYYVASDVYVIASISDPCPKAFNEAMNFSLAIIGSDGVGTAFDLVNEGINGFYYKKGDFAQLHNSMKKMTYDKKKLRKMGEESLKIVSKWNFNEDVKATLKALNRIYENKKTIAEKSKAPSERK